MTRNAPLRPARELKSDAGDGDRDPHELLDEIASELNLLIESYSNPDAFLERRDMLVKRLRRLSKRLRGGEPAVATTTWRNPSPQPAQPRSARTITIFRRC